MTNPAIQNDFSYYRRTISRNRINNLQVRGQRRSPRTPPSPGGGLPWGGSQDRGWLGVGVGHPNGPHHPPPLQLDAESEVNNEMANRMSLFYAEATPMLKTLSNATTKFVSEVREAGGGGTLRAGGSPPPAPAPCRGQEEKRQPGPAGFQNKTLPIEDTTDCLSTMACVCRVMLETP